MDIEVTDIMGAFYQYLATEVTATITAITPGPTIKAGEDFIVTIEGKNGGVTLRNVRYFIGVVDPEVALLQVPGGTIAPDLGSDPVLDPEIAFLRVPQGATAIALGSGHPLPGSFVQGLIYNPHGSDFEFEPYDTDIISIRGRATKDVAAEETKTTKIRVKLFADFDLDKLFAKGEGGHLSNRTIQVVG